VIVILKLIYSFTVLNYGPKRLVCLAVLRMPKSLMGILKPDGNNGDNPA